MSSLKAEVIYEMNTEQFVPAASTAERALQQIKSKTQDTAKEIENLEKKVTQTKERVAASFTGMVSNATALAFSFRDLGDSQVQIDSLALKIRKLEQSMKDTTLTADEMAIKQEEHRILTERYTNAIEDQQKAQVQFGLSMVTMATTTIPTTIAAVTQMRAAQAALATAHVATAGAATTQAVANVGLTASFRALTAAMLTNPLGIALVAGSIGALAVYETNLFGVKDKVDSLIGSFGGATPKMQEFNTELQTGGVPTMQQYGNSVADTTSKMDGLNRTIDITASKIDTLKKNETDLMGILNDSYMAVGSLMSIADVLNDQAAKQQLIDIQRKWEQMTEERNRKFLEDTIGMPTFTDAIGPNYRNISFAGLSGQQARILSYFSERVTSVFDAARASGVLSNTDLLHGNLGYLGGIGQNYLNTLNSMREYSAGRYKPTNPGGSIGSKAQSLGGISAGKGAKGKSSKHGGGSVSPWAISADIYKAYDANKAVADQLALFGFKIDVPSYSFAGNPGQYRSPSNEYIASVQNAANANYAAGLARYNAQVAAARAQIAQDAGFIGLDPGTYMNMYVTYQGHEDIEGMKLFKMISSMG